MKLILDYRERDLQKACELLVGSCEIFKDIVITTENLELGDIAIRDIDNNDIVIYERKTITDLVSSIKDGRYSEQSYRMNGLEHHNHNIVYLIEGSISKTNKDKQMVYSAMFSINHYKGFSVMRSSNVEESAYIICNAILKIYKEKGKTPYYPNKKLSNDVDGNADTTSVSYSSVIKTKKSSNITADNFGEIVLCQIPSISAKTSCAIMKEYKTVANLIDAIQKDNNILNNITYQTEKNQTRKISKTSIKNIIDFLSK
jgi:ERCC4-type nuclease